jgi:pimeloyl-ACP methyl ester carboxylesterase
LPHREVQLPPYSLWEARSGSGTPIALIHGLGGSTRWWKKNIAALGETHTVAALDLLGFGRNARFWAPPRVAPPFREASALVARWLETFGEPVHLVAHSMGGLIAIRVAAERPELLRSLTLVCAAGIPFALDPKPHLRAMPQPIRGAVRITRFALPDFLRAGPTAVTTAGARILLTDVREWLPLIDVPALVLWGAHDPVVPLHYGEEMHRAIAGSRMVVLPDAAHVPMWEAPDAFNEAVLRFVADVEKTPPRAVTGRAFTWGIAGWTDGIAHRQSGRRRNVVLIHGLGLSSAYFDRFARALFARGLDPIAPDLPGFGESVNGLPASPAEHAAMLVKWADALGIRDAIWIGHSVGCNTVAHVARLRPDLVRDAVYIGAIWRNAKHPIVALSLLLALDGLREPAALWSYVLRAYWRTGLARWIATFLRYNADARCDAHPRSGHFISGERDPIVDRECVTPREVRGAHACHFSAPDECADAVQVACSVSAQRR